jgi:hypothetical protein
MCILLFDGHDARSALCNRRELDLQPMTSAGSVIVGRDHQANDPVPLRSNGP